MFLNLTSNGKKKHGGVELFDQILFLRRRNIPSRWSWSWILQPRVNTSQKDWMGHPSTYSNTYPLARPEQPPHAAVIQYWTAQMMAINQPSGLKREAKTAQHKKANGNYGILQGVYCITSIVVPDKSWINRPREKQLVMFESFWDRRKRTRQSVAGGQIVSSILSIKGGHPPVLSTSSKHSSTTISNTIKQPFQSLSKLPSKSFKMQLTSIFTLIALTVAGVHAMPNGGGHPAPPPPPPPAPPAPPVINHQVNYCSSGAPYCCSPSSENGSGVGTTCVLSTTQCNSVSICCNNAANGAGSSAVSISSP